ncbi:MAG: DUF4446 family protein [Candidatus Staskawiczbacteria bacterium]|nr:DUF4446 family protein [Candidatus Staskawiczbacteria bacterium]
MDIVLIFLIISGIIILFLVITNAFLIRYFYRTNKKIDTLLENGKIKDFKDIFLSQKEKNNDLEKQIKEAFLKIKNLEDTCETTIQKIGVVRFNPFNDIGGNQSFVIALLDNKNDGFLISSLFVKEGSRVYTKAVKNGKSDHTLLKEETEAIEKAIGSK